MFSFTPLLLALLQIFPSLGNNTEFIWNRTRCGSQSSKTDLITQWGLQVTPDNVLPDYPRPQLSRINNWMNLNGLWQFEGSNKPFQQSTTNLSDIILVPFPPESCLSGIHATYQYLQYQYYFNDFSNRNKSYTKVLLNFGAVDWKSDIYINNKYIGNHTGGYDSFSFDITQYITDENNSVYLSVYDPSDLGQQPNGKQEIAAFYGPVSNGNKYTPTSGIWQTVWLEYVPKTYISNIQLFPSLTNIAVNISISGDLQTDTVTLQAFDKDLQKIVATITGKTNKLLTLNIPNPKLWSPKSPFLYDLYIKLDSGDQIQSYFGLRTFTLGLFNNSEGKAVARPLLNNEPIFVSAWLDQSFWPDGIYVAPTDEALLFDLKAILQYGLNGVRVHQKVNPERWYYHADRLGIIVEQDMVQRRENATIECVNYFKSDLIAMIKGKFNHPSIIQWNIFNEDDYWNVFPSINKVVSYVKALDSTRLIDDDSGGDTNHQHIGAVNDFHEYPYPGDPQPYEDYQYAMLGEYGGIGCFISGKEWVKNGCSSQSTKVYNPSDFASIYVNMSKMILEGSGDISAVIYSQLSDIEEECDGFFNYDRTQKWNTQQTKLVIDANQNMIKNMWN
eukprot:158166_1